MALMGQRVCQYGVGYLSVSAGHWRAGGGAGSDMDPAGISTLEEFAEAFKQLCAALAVHRSHRPGERLLGAELTDGEPDTPLVTGRPGP